MRRHSPRGVGATPWAIMAQTNERSCHSASPRPRPLRRCRRVSRQNSDGHMAARAPNQHPGPGVSLTNAARRRSSCRRGAFAGLFPAQRAVAVTPVVALEPNEAHPSAGRTQYGALNDEESPAFAAVLFRPWSWHRRVPVQEVGQPVAHGPKRRHAPTSSRHVPRPGGAARRSRSPQISHRRGALHEAGRS